MADHFAAFSFVDRITELSPGKRARGVFAVPPDVAPFSSCLIAEAVGQLAAWVAMSHIAFQGRPVAALANETLLSGDAAPGRTLDLAVEIDDCDEEAVSYSGWAKVDGTRVIALNDCLGPMLPLADFDSPDAMHERFELLCGEGALPGRFRGLPPLSLMDVTKEDARMAASLRVPQSAPFFADHFPRRPVFPATLLLDTQIRLAMELAGHAKPWPTGTKPVPTRMTHVKMRSFIEPGDVLALTAEWSPADTDRVLLSAKSGDRTIATARVELATVTM